MYEQQTDVDDRQDGEQDHQFPHGSKGRCADRLWEEVRGGSIFRR
jgi:hypothetical protein